MNKVKYYREKQGMTQEELATESTVSRTIISDLENNKKTVITNITMQKIADALGKKVTTIFFPKSVQHNEQKRC